MKKTKLILIMVISICLATLSFTETNDSAVAGTIKNQTPSGTPKAVVAQKALTFDEILEGKIVTQAFLIENQGTAPLKVLEIRTSCGCTTAKRPGLIAPGGWDRIVVQADTNGYGGRVFRKTIMVSTNDPLHPRIELQLSGTVVAFAHIEPRHIVLRGQKDTRLQAEATITPNPKFPFRMTSTEIDKQLAEKIDVQIEQREGIYHIIVSNRMSAPGKYWGKLTLNTDSAAQPTLSLFIRGHIME
jgi:hypothetical protein